MLPRKFFGTGGVILGLVWAVSFQKLAAQPVVNQGMEHGTGRWMMVTEMTSTRLPVFTLEGWIKASSRVVLAARDLPASMNADWSLVYNWPAQCLEFMTQINAGPDTYVYSSTNSLTPNQWQHIAIVVNGPAGSIRGYVNGNQVLNSGFSPRQFDANVGLSWAGYFSGGGGGDGRMDELRYWNLERTQQQLVNAKDGPLAPNDRSGLVGYWRFCGNYADSSGHGNDGSPNGTTIVDVPELPAFACCPNGISTPTHISASGKTNFCPGDSVTLDAGAGYSKYRWSNGDSTQSITVKVGGRYTVLVFEGDRCPSMAGIVVQAAANPAPIILGPAIRCHGELVCLETSAAYSSYAWSTGENTRKICVSTPGMYTVTVVDSNGCTGQAARAITQHVSALHASGPGALCPGQQAYLSADSGYVSYRWSNGGTLRRTIVDGPGDYTVQAVSADGCTDTARISIAERIVPVSITATGPLRLCAHDVTTLVATDGYRMYRWSTGAMTRQIVIKDTGLYTVTVTDSAGCSGSAQIVITGGEALKPLILGPRLLCEGGSIMLEAGDGYFSYRWSTGDSTRRISVRQAGNYTVTVTDSAGCTGIASIDVMKSALPTPVISGPNILCEGAVAELEVVSAYVHYQWSTGDSTRKILARKAGKYSVTVTDSNGCQGLAEWELLAGIAPKPLISGVLALCYGDTTVLDAGAGHAAYLWSTGAATRTIRVGQAGVYSVTVTAPNGCTGIASVHVAMGAGTPYIGGNPLLCADSTVLSVFPAFASYRWSTGETTKSIVSRSPGFYSVTVLDSLGCGAVATITVRSGSRLQPHIVGSRYLCDGDSTLLSVDGLCDSCRWSTGDTSRSIWVRNPGMYSVSVQRVGFCPGGADTVHVLPRSKPAPRIAGPAVLCEGDTALFSVTAIGGRSFRWSRTGGGIPGAFDSAEVLLRWATPGNWIVSVIETDDSSGCKDSTMLPITVFPRPHPVITADGSLHFCEGDSLLLDAGSGYASYRWSDGSTVQRRTVRLGGTYSVTVENADGCVATAEISVTMTAGPSVRIAGPASVCLNAVAKYRVLSNDSTNLHWIAEGGALLGPDGTDSAEIAWGASGTGRVIILASRLGCASADTLTVSIGGNRTLAIGASPSTSACEGDSILLDAGSGFSSYVWLDSAGSRIGNDRFLAVRHGGVYSVTARDSTRCTGNGSISIAMHPTPRPRIAGPSAFCDGDTIALDGGRDYVAWRWSNGDTARIIHVSQAGTFTVAARDTNGCEGYADPFTVAKYPPPLPSITQLHDTLESAAAKSYQWYFEHVLLPGATARRLVANAEGAYSVRIVDDNGCAAWAFTNWSAPEVIVELPFLEALPGERVSIPIRVRTNAQLDALGLTGYRTAIRFDGGILRLSGTADSSSGDGEQRIVVLQSAAPVHENPLRVVSGIAMLGSVDRTPLSFDSFEFTGAFVRVTRIDGELRLRVCQEGGTRLFSDSNRLFLAQNRPNPFNPLTAIDFGTIETAHVMLLVYDVAGREAARLIDGVLEAGQHTIHFDATRLPSGVYRYALITPGRMLVRTMLLMK